MEFLWKGRDHLRFSTKHGFKIFAFYMWDYYEKLKIWQREWRKIDLIFDVSEDSWMGKKNLMLKSSWCCIELSNKINLINVN